MPDETPKKRPLSEIGHLFLSSLRDQHLGARPRPGGCRRACGGNKLPGRRMRWASPRPGPNATPPPPPAQRQHRHDAGGVHPVVRADRTAGRPDGRPGHGCRGANPASSPSAPSPPSSPGHLTGTQLDRARQYARHLAARDGRIGLIELDASEFRLMCFEPGADRRAGGRDPAAQSGLLQHPRDHRGDRGAELGHRPLAPGHPQPADAGGQGAAPRGRALVLLTTCDHDGVVAAYRMLKGLADHAAWTDSGRG